MQLYHYWRSTAAYRVRIALQLKNIECELLPVDLVADGGQQHSDTYRQLNPAGLVPTLIDGEVVLHQSMAILQYLEDRFPEPSLLPSMPAAKAKVLALCYDIACDIHPLNNLRVMNYLKNDCDQDGDGVLSWYHHWLKQGFTALEAEAVRHSSGGEYLWGDGLSLADVLLIPQVYNARRFNFALDAFPTLVAIDKHCRALPAFVAAAPESQAEAPKQ